MSSIHLGSGHLLTHLDFRNLYILRSEAGAYMIINAKGKVYIVGIAVALLITAGIVIHGLQSPGYASQSLSPNPQLVIVTRVYASTNVQSRLFNIHQSKQIKTLMDLLNKEYGVIPRGAIYSGLPLPPIDYYISLRYQNTSEDQLMIVNLPGHSMENVKTGIIYNISLFSNKRTSRTMIHFLDGLFNKK
ncbi:hypothetical protein B2M26_04190 [Ferroacidibacillus organovorans]|uniref:Uncharacterized protein n=2 Tax=Ferroacidibacillus organovorans TaxID=1765683 RepID=A0A1V4EVF5_9BACL|nr:hypothetical protein B2M26_04190 [Ferroacidibacillus organovorans]